MSRRGRAPADHAAVAPRPHLWLTRRVLAFAVDHTLAVLLVGLLSLPLADLGLRLPRPLLHLRLQSCIALDAPPAWLARWAGTDTLSVLRLCEGRFYGLADGLDIVALAEGVPAADGSRPVRAIRQPVGSDLSPAPNLPGLPALLVLAVLGLASALLTRAGRPSPGKALLGLRLVGPPAGAPLREILRLGPLALPPAVTLASGLGLLPPLILWEFGAVATLAAAAAVACLWYYIWPVLRGNGALRHDRLAGYRVIRRGNPSQGPALAVPGDGA